MLIDMKYSKAERSEEAKEYSQNPDYFPDYPYGLTLSLEKEELDKLGMSEYEIGDELNISAVGKITMVKQSETENKPEEACITIQITKLDLQDADEKAEAVEAKGKVSTPLTNSMR